MTRVIDLNEIKLWPSAFIISIILEWHIQFWILLDKLMLHAFIKTIKYRNEI